MLDDLETRIEKLRNDASKAAQVIRGDIQSALQKASTSLELKTRSEGPDLHAIQLISSTSALQNEAINILIKPIGEVFVEFWNQEHSGEAAFEQVRLPYADTTDVESLSARVVLAICGRQNDHGLANEFSALLSGVPPRAAEDFEASTPSP